MQLLKPHRHVSTSKYCPEAGPEPPGREKPGEPSSSIPSRKSNARKLYVWYRGRPPTFIAALFPSGPDLEALRHSDILWLSFALAPRGFNATFSFQPTANPKAQHEEGRAGNDEKYLDIDLDPVVRPVERDADANGLT